MAGPGGPSSYISHNSTQLYMHRNFGLGQNSFANPVAACRDSTGDTVCRAPIIGQPYSKKIPGTRYGYFSRGRIIYGSIKKLSEYLLAGFAVADYYIEVAALRLCNFDTL